MEISHTGFYFLLMLDNIHKLFAGLVLFSIFGIFISLMCWGMPLSEDMEKSSNITKKCLRWAIATFVISVLGAVFIPDTKQMAAIIVVPKLVNSDFVQKDLPEETKEVYGLFKQWLRAEIKEPKKTE